MRQSRIIRMSFLVLFVGVGLWCVMVLPASFSQEDPNFNPPRTAAPPSDGFGAPGGLAPPAAGAGGAAPVAPMTDDFGAVPGTIAAGPPAAVNPGGGAGGPPGLDLEFDSGSGSTAGAAPAGGAMPPGAMGRPAGMMGMMGGGMGPGMTPSQIEEMNLARHAKALLSRYGKEQKPEVKEQIKTELRAVLHRQFRLQHQRRDAELTRIERRLADLRAKLKRRGDNQSTIVDRRLEQLVNDVDGLGWSVEEVPDNLFNEGGMGSMMMMPGMPGMGGGASMRGPGGGGFGSFSGFGGGGIGEAGSAVGAPAPTGTGFDSVPPKEEVNDVGPVTPNPNSDPNNLPEPSTNPAATVPPAAVPGAVPPITPTSPEQ